MYILIIAILLIVVLVIVYFVIKDYEHDYTYKMHNNYKIVIMSVIVISLIVSNFFNEVQIQNSNLIHYESVNE